MLKREKLKLVAFSQHCVLHQSLDIVVSKKKMAPLSSSSSSLTYFNRLKTCSWSIPMIVRCSSTTSSNTFNICQPLPFTAMPGPKGSFANLLNYTWNGGLRNVLETHRKRFERFGPIYREQVFSRHLVNISDVEAIEKVFRVPSAFPIRPGMEAMDAVVEEINFNFGLLSNDYARWYRDRSLLSRKMLHPKQLNQALEGFNDVANEFVNRLHRLRQVDGTVKNIENELFYWGVESLSTWFFGQRLGFYDYPPDPEAVEFVDTTNDVTMHLGNLIYGFSTNKNLKTPQHYRMKKTLLKLSRLGQEIINKKVLTKQQQPRQDDHKPKKPTVFDYISSKVKQDHVVDLMTTMMAAGVDTSSVSFLWLLYHISRHPDTQEKLYQELTRVLGMNGDISETTLPRLPFLKASFKESMRLKPAAAAVPRKFDHDIEVLGYNIPAGVNIMMFTYLLSVDESIFGANAKQFVPERWLRDETDRKIEYHPFSTLPFGYGVRMCLGRRVSEAEVYTLLSKILLSFRVEYAANSEIKPHLVGALIRPSKPAVIKFLPR